MLEWKVAYPRCNTYLASDGGDGMEKGQAWSDHALRKPVEPRTESPFSPNRPEGKDGNEVRMVILR